MDNPIIAKEAQTITLKNNRLIKKENLTPDTKAWIKKAIDTKKGLAKK